MLMGFISFFVQVPMVVILLVRVFSEETYLNIIWCTRLVFIHGQLVLAMFAPK